MFHHILVLLDGSLRAERALPVAAHLARAGHGTLTLLCVVRENQAQADHIETSLFQKIVQSELDEAHRYLTRVASADQLAGLPLNAVVLPGPVLAASQNAVRSYQVDLVVCGEQAEPQDPARFLGAFATQLIEHLPVPVLLIPAQGALPLGSFAPTTFVVAFTGSNPDSDLVPPASALLAALTDGKPGFLQFVPLHTLRSPSMERMIGCEDPDRHTQANGRNNVFILATPPSDMTTIPPALNTHPRLFVPLEQQQQAIHA